MTITENNTEQGPRNENKQGGGGAVNSHPKEVLQFIAPKGKIKLTDNVPGRLKPQKNLLTA